MEKMKVYRQGDILMKQINSIPKKAEPLNHRVLAYGEATGHRHELTAGQLYDADGVLCFQLAQEVDLTHQEHDTITLPIGNYEVIRQKEHSPERRIYYVED